ncbi:MAG: acetate/propionate family kinase [Isosphaeraceae bacterium]
MKILVANLGSTSFKYRLFDLADPAEPVLARGAVERIGTASSPCTVHLPTGPQTREAHVPDHGVAVRMCLEQLTDPATGVLKSADEVAAIGFKAVHAKHLSGVVRVNTEVLSAMEAYADVCPAHNPPYTKAMRLLAEKLPEIPLVAAFETDFHQSIPEASKRYAIPEEWATSLGVKRHGFHGASHRFIATRMAQILGRNDAKIISCHLGGSNSLAAIDAGSSRGCSLGMSPQTGLPHNNRVGDFDVFALPVILRETGQSLEQVLHILAEKSGLLGICGLNDLRDIEFAAGQGNVQARLALDLFVTDIRRYLGAFLVTLGGADVIVFTGGIGENSKVVRRGVCENLGWFGIELDLARNETARGESRLSSDSSRVQIWTVPTNEELIVARQTRDLLQAR